MADYGDMTKKGAVLVFTEQPLFYWLYRRWRFFCSFWFSPDPGLKSLPRSGQRLSLSFHGEQIGNCRLEINAVPGFGWIFQGDFHGMGGVFGRDFESIPPGHAPHDFADAGAGKEIAGAVIDRVNARALVGEIRVACPLVGHHADLSRLQADAGQHADLCAECVQPHQKILDVGFIVFLAVCRAGHKGRFRDVRNDNVGFRAELRVFLHVLHVEGRVQLAVVGHDRIDEDNRVLAPEIPEELFHLIDLVDCTKIAGIDGVKGKTLFFPVLNNGVELVGKILAGEILEHCMSGQHRRGQDDCLAAERRDDGQCDSQGAFAQT